MTILFLIWIQIYTLEFYIMGTIISINILMLVFIGAAFSHLSYEHEVVNVKMNDKSKRRTFNADENPKQINIDFYTMNRQYNLTLFLNEHLLTPSFEVLEKSKDGSSFERKGKQRNCFYQGYIEDDLKTKVVASICQGFHIYLRHENGEEYTVRPSNESATFSDEHIFYRVNRAKHNQSEHKCGVKHAQSNAIDSKKYFSTEFLSKYLPATFGDKKEDLKINQTKYISVIVILDASFCKKYGDKSELKAVDIMNNVDTIYKHMKTRVALQAIILWKNGNPINVTNIAEDTLNNLREYTDKYLFGKLALNADSFVLLTSVSLNEHIVGFAGVGTMCSSQSCALVEAFTQDEARVADTVAHEIGHTLGFEHIISSCTCKNEPCVMSASAPSTLAQGFADCTQEKYLEQLNKGSLSCLFDYPTKLYGKPICGNGFVEDGEECDCGSEDECKSSGADKCCIAKTCKLQSSAFCAAGECCENCQAKAQGTLCRKFYDADCDLPEYCSGVSAHCPSNTYAMDGYPCRTNNGSCLNGECKNLFEQCQMLWGPNAIPANEACFNLNTHKNDSLANCGAKGNSFLSCAKDDIYCGKLQCTAMEGKSLPKFPVLGEEQGGRTAKIVILGDDSQCNMAYVPFDRDQQDPTRTQDGTKCGEGKVCEKNKCRNKTEISHYGTTCEGGCLNGGICNNNGNCHCPVNYTCPNCFYDPGSLGGSYDSGQGCYKENKTKLKLMELITIAGCSLLVLIIIALCCVAIGKRKSFREYRKKQMTPPDANGALSERKKQLNLTKGTGPQEMFQLPNRAEEVVLQNLGKDNKGLSMQTEGGLQNLERPDSSHDHLRLDIHPPTYRENVRMRNETVPHLVVGRTDDVVNISVKYKTKEKRPGNQVASSKQIPDIDI